MKIPKYIKTAIMSRATHYHKANEIDQKISSWLNKNNIVVDPCDINFGVESVSLPYESSKRLIEAIENHSVLK